MKCGPDDCPIKAFSDLTPAEQRVERKRMAMKMSGQGFTEQQIAKQFGVSQQQISRDLSSLHIESKLTPHATSKRGRKGEGRPKRRAGPQIKRRRNDASTEKTLASLVLDRGKTYKQAATETGAGSEQVAKLAVAREEGRREIEPIIDPETLTPSAKVKLEVCKRTMERKLDAEHAARMQKLDEEVHQRVLKEGKEYIATLQEMRDKVAADEKWYRTLINDHKPPFTVEQYRAILMCLHPDGERTLVKLHEAFILLESKKEMLTGERKKRVA